MKTAVFGHDDSCGESNSGGGPMAPPLTFAAPASLSVTGSSHQRRSGASTAAVVSGGGTGTGSNTPNMFRAHSRRTSRMQNVSPF
uniref:Uncharacterized protein n=1 Tax=Panagrolaimus davidi TaxID=227884 RepID=A0A914PLK4_9BILA